MAHRHQKFIFSIAVIFTAILHPFSAGAQGSAAQPVLASNRILNVKVNTDPAGVPDNSRTVIAPVPVTSKMAGARERKKLMVYLKELNVPEDLDHYQSHQKLYYHLANVFAHLKLYPLAMKCFLKTQVNYPPGNATATDAFSQAGSPALNMDYLRLSAKDDSVVNSRAVTNNGSQDEKTSKKIGFDRICNAFNDGKTAIAYAMLFHVKQPVPGKRKIFLWANTGHTFITLIKYNSDSTFASASFGFYPEKDRLLSATPLNPSTSSTFKDDAGHKWDEVLGKFISRRKFEKILLLTGAYAGMEYNLNNNNCTDFGINAAAIAGININETKGKWPLGSGNNPAVTGQSILFGKFSNIIPNDPDSLFVDSTVVPGK